MPELLLELLSEEIPARMQARAAEDLKRLLCESLKKAGLPFDRAEAYATPRRLTLVVDGLPTENPAVVSERKGPKIDAPDKALAGFARSIGASEDFVPKFRNLEPDGDSLSFIVLTDVGPGDTVNVSAIRTATGVAIFSTRSTLGRPTAQMLPKFINSAIGAFPWPKSMRWPGADFRWVRPLQGVLAIFDGKILHGGLHFSTRKVPEKILELPDWDISTDEPKFTDKTRGHRFHAKDEFSVKRFADYREKLRAAKVVLDREERKELIAEGAARLATAEGLTLKDDPGLLDEVAGLVEWPVVLMGTIDDAFMDLPPEVLTGSMRGHQKYFSTLDGAGRLANRFVLVANMETADEGAAIVAGNERVLRARLADARFFWDRDRRRSLASRAPDLGQMVFHAKLGNLDDKADRMQALAAELCHHVPGADIDRVRSAARLAKADLTTGMVGEFPELQGVMGRYYALADGEHAEVAEAIAEHYAPQGPNDRCPNAPVSLVVALADKLDTLAGFWTIGETPTGSKDPYALRRAALGVIRLIVENGLRVPLTGVIETARGLYRGVEGDSVAAPLLDFFADRLKVALRDKGVRHDLISAVFAKSQAETATESGLAGQVDLVRVLARVKALQDFLSTDDGKNLLVAYRRAANIVRIEEKRDNRRYPGYPEEDTLDQTEEKELYRNLVQVKGQSKEALRKEDFVEAMAHLANLRSPVDSFFDEVTVNCDEPELRENRLQLLALIRWTIDEIADFSKVEGS